MTLTLVFSFPQIVVGCFFLKDILWRGNWRDYIPRIPGIVSTSYFYDPVYAAPFWHDKFVIVRGQPTPDRNWKSEVFGIDPETSEQSDLKLDVIAREYLQAKTFDNQLMLVGQSAAYEELNGVLQPSNFVRPPVWNALEFLWEGKQAYVEKKSNGFFVSTWMAGTWVKEGMVVVPDTDRPRLLNGEQIQLGLTDSICVLNQEERVHIVFRADGHLLYCQKLELRPTVSYTMGMSGQITVEEVSDQAVSALTPVNTDDDLACWSLVCKVPVPKAISPGLAMREREFHLMLIGEQPAVLLVDGMQSGNPIGHIYRFDGAAWTDFATQPFPFGSREFRTVTVADGSKSFIVATTSTGISQVYAVETTGIRKTNGAETPNPLRALRDFFLYGFALFSTLLLGVLAGAGTSLLMWWYTQPDYAFGHRTVRLASLGRRGLARLIDIAAVVTTTIGLGWLLTRDFDWMLLVEALNQKVINPQVDHPTLAAVSRAGTILSIWLAFAIAALIVAQGRWGITPGKWLCRLRVFRTTLQPCGFVHSLAREVVFFVDCCNFLCWSPGIASIALTGQRQRLGDLVADAIVVDIRSWKPSTH